MSTEGRFIGPPDNFAGGGKRYRLLTRTFSNEEDGATETESVEVVALQNPDGSIVDFGALLKAVAETNDLLRDLLKQSLYGGS